MNINFKRIPIEKVLFVDSETARRMKELDPESKEFELYRKKIRDRSTEELPTIVQTIDDYNRKAGLKMGYAKIITISIAFVRANEVYVKALTGEEEYILRAFFDIMSKFDYVCGMNILAFDLPLMYFNATQYFDYTDIVPDKFVTSGKKPWELKAIIDLMDVVRGTHYANMSLEEILYFFGLESSKTDMDGSMVSDAYYNGEIDRIAQYAKQDVFANVNLFSMLQSRMVWSEFVDRTDSPETEKEKPQPLQRLYETDYLSDQIKADLKDVFGKKRLNKKDKEFIQDVLENIYIRTAFMASDTEDVKEAKKAEIQEFLKTL